MKLQKPPRVHSLRTETDRQTEEAIITDKAPYRNTQTPGAPMPSPFPLPVPHLILTAARLPEVGDRRQLGVHGLPVEPAVIEFGHSPLCILLPAELRGKWGDGGLVELGTRRGTDWVSSEAGLDLAVLLGL